MEQFHLESIEFKKKVAFYGKYRLKLRCNTKSNFVSGDAVL